jgi:hypothetical protein
MTTLVMLHCIVADEGSVVLFSGVHNELERPSEVVVAVDCRMAQPIADALSEGFQPVVAAESWQIWGRGYEPATPAHGAAAGPPPGCSGSGFVEHEEASDKDIVSDTWRHLEGQLGRHPGRPDKQPDP